MKTDSLRPCPATPNCVCSVYPDDASHFIQPLPFIPGVPVDQQLTELKQRCEKHFRVEVIQQEATYLHLVFVSLIFRFRDDVEFVLNETQEQIHVRSASRVGHSDLGANQRRVEKIRALLQP
jgi:uncharacterized protein (DUF1499 family)